MNIILPVIYYAQNFWDKIIEPELSKLIIKSVISSKNKTLLSFENDLVDLVKFCGDQDFIDEYHYVCNTALKEKSLAKIYYDYIYSSLLNYCKINKIQLLLKEDCYSFELIW